MARTAGVNNEGEQWWGLRGAAVQRQSIVDSLWTQARSTTETTPGDIDDLFLMLLSQDVLTVEGCGK